MFNLLRLLSVILILTSCSSKPTRTIEPQKPIESPVENLFDYKSSLDKVKKISDCANKVYRDEQFIVELKSKTSFDYSDDSGVDVYNKMIAHHCVIRTYKTKNPFSKVFATTYSNNNIDLYLNWRKYQDVPGWVGTSHHECSHNYGYSHGNNSSVGKQNTVPYWLGSLATKHAKRICK